MTSRLEKMTAYQDALSIAKTHAHFGVPAGPRMDSRYPMKALFKACLATKRKV